MANVVKDLSTNVLQIVVFALVIGTILGASAFTSITLVNITALSAQYGLAITAFVGFFALIGTVGALVWLFKYIKPLFDKNTGINSVVA
jgi:hypothetical protein